MIWYGLKNIKWRNEIKNLKLRNKLRVRTLNIDFQNNINLSVTRLLFHIPKLFNLIVFNLKLNTKGSLIYLFSNIYFFYIPFRKYKFKFYYDAQTKILSFSNLYSNNFFFLYWTFLKSIFYSFSQIFFKKLKFRGKGYYVYKNIRNTVATQFGYSHMIRIYGYKISLKFLTKTIIFVYGINKYDILLMGKNIFFKRPYNIFTGKGVRFSRQVIYKKTGKLSTYR